MADRPPPAAPYQPRHTQPILASGVEIHGLDEFLGYALRMEEEAAEHYDELTVAMQACGNLAVARLFAKLARCSRQHTHDVAEHAKHHRVTPVLPSSVTWPDHHPPERTALVAGRPQLSRSQALEAALQAERRGQKFYETVARASTDPDMQRLASLFAQEEAGHVKTLQDWHEQEQHHEAPPPVD